MHEPTRRQTIPSNSLKVLRKIRAVYHDVRVRLNWIFKEEEWCSVREDRSLFLSFLWYCLKIVKTSGARALKSIENATV